VKSPLSRAPAGGVIFNSIASSSIPLLSIGFSEPPSNAARTFPFTLAPDNEPVPFPHLLLSRSIAPLIDRTLLHKFLLFNFSRLSCFPTFDLRRNERSRKCAMVFGSNFPNHNATQYLQRFRSLLSALSLRLKTSFFHFGSLVACPQGRVEEKCLRHFGNCQVLQHQVGLTGLSDLP
jgi:hypothetical protein